MSNQTIIDLLQNLGIGLCGIGIFALSMAIRRR